MRKYIKNIVFLMLILFILAGCSKQKVDTSKLNIVTSFYPMYVATANIVDGIENVELRNLTDVTTGCLHDYQLTTSNMINLSTADILVVNGGGMENFIEKAVSIYEDIKVIDASKGILESHESEYIDFEYQNTNNQNEHEHIHEDIDNVHGHKEHAHDHGENAHIWVSVSMYIEQIENIRDELIKINPENADKYIENSKKYISKLEALKLNMHNTLEKLENKNIVTFHEAFEFFAEEFNLNIVAVIEREPGTYPSARDVAEIIDLVRSKEVKAIFIEPQYSRSAADTIARETGVSVYTLDPIVTGDLNKDSYIKIMEQNLKILEDALK